MSDHDHSHEHPAAAEHGATRGGWLRPAVFGVSDGLVSNAALVLGVAAGQAGGHVVLLAGVSGLLAGAFSMAAGEWVSVLAERESFELELRREEEHIRRYPDEESAHMRRILRDAGLPADLTDHIVAELRERPEANLDFHARVELGIDPTNLSSPAVAAFSSFFAFALGAAIPLLPWLHANTDLAVKLSIGLSALALFSVGALLAGFTGRHPAWSGARQLLIGSAAAGVTTAIGAWIGA